MASGSLIASGRPVSCGAKEDGAEPDAMSSNRSAHWIRPVKIGMRKMLVSIGISEPLSSASPLMTQKPPMPITYSMANQCQLPAILARRENLASSSVGSPRPDRPGHYAPAAPDHHRHQNDDAHIRHIVYHFKAFLADSAPMQQNIA